MAGIIRRGHAVLWLGIDQCFTHVLQGPGLLSKIYVKDITGDSLKKNESIACIA